MTEANTATQDEQKNPTHDPRYHWDREEHILLLDEYLRHAPHFPGKESKEVKEMSALLRSYHMQKGNPIHDQLRNANGVYMKLMNFRRFDPSTESKGLPKGNRLEGEIWDEYANDKSTLHHTATLIRSAIQQGFQFLDDESVESPEMETEGRVIGALHKRYERSQKNKRAKIKSFKGQNGRVFCEACGFDFEKIYGERGVDFCEVHHEIPVSRMEVGSATRIEDLCCLCANCHRMIHRRRPWLTVSDLSLLLASRKNGDLCN
jgi:5-methylcytosine-specific restriction protein A